MSRGQQGSKGQRQKAAINGSLNKNGELILPSLSPSARLLQGGEGIPRSRQRRANSLALQITFCNGLEKWTGTFNWPIKRKQSSQSADTQRKANRICFISCQIHRRLRPLPSTSAQLIMNISNSSESFILCCINKRSENQFLFLLWYRIILLLKTGKVELNFKNLI